MSFSRRDFLARTSASVLATAVPCRFTGAQSRSNDLRRYDVYPLENDPDLRALATHALDAAKSAGVVYTDVRFRVTEREEWAIGENGYQPPSSVSIASVGIRALCNGYWGYAGLDGDATMEDMARLGREAATQAKRGSQGKARTVELAPTPVATGSWVMPVKIDPFSVSWEEKVDIIGSMRRSFGMHGFRISCLGDATFVRERQTFASSDGAFCCQTFFNTFLRRWVTVPEDWLTEQIGQRSVDYVGIVGAGWEYVLDADKLIEDHARQLIEEAIQMRRPKPVDVGRYDIVFDGSALANLIDATLGPATELDRAMGYEANTLGTSFLNDPLHQVGVFKMGSPLLNLRANRSMAGGCATVKWDDEGVEPDETVLVKDGILNDFQTTRESASWLSPYYQKSGKPVRSHGGAMSGRLDRAPTQGACNLVMEPATQDIAIDELISGVKRGLLVLSGQSRADQQALNAESGGNIVYEIINGRRGRVISDAVILTRTPEFWKNLDGIGGAKTVVPVGIERSRHWNQNLTHTVSAPAALVRNVAVTTNFRRGA